MIIIYTLKQLAQKLDAKLYGDDACEISGVASLEVATAGQACFVESAKHAKKLAMTKASVVLLTAELLEKSPTNALVVDRPRLVFAELLRLLYPQPAFKPGKHPSSIIGDHCVIAPSAYLGPNVVIGNDVKIGEHCFIAAGCVIADGVEIGNDCWLHPRVTLYAAVKLGARAIIHSGAVIGADGFGFEPNATGQWVKLLQIGKVIIGDDVEIGANTTIDCGAMSDTVIGNGVKLDNQIVIAHNVKIGDHTLIAGGTAIGGSATLGQHCIIGGHSAINGHITLGDNVIVTGCGMVTRSLLTPGVYSSGTGVLSNNQWLKAVVRFRQLDDMHHRLKEVERVEYE